MKSIMPTFFYSLFSRRLVGWPCLFRAVRPHQLGRMLPVFCAVALVGCFVDASRSAAPCSPLQGDSPNQNNYKRDEQRGLHYVKRVHLIWSQGLGDRKDNLRPGRFFDVQPLLRKPLETLAERLSEVGTIATRERLLSDSEDPELPGGNEGSSASVDVEDQQTSGVEDEQRKTKTSDVEDHLEKTPTIIRSVGLEDPQKSFQTSLEADIQCGLFGTADPVKILPPHLLV
ncbi:unnamed protein product, partial [Amoebophrya sp. A25]|eukprot:GSA25T00023110001.1